MIRRIKDYGKKAPCRDAHKVYIVCEGAGTEPDYFAFFEGCSSNLQIITIPPSDGTDPLKLMERAKDMLLRENHTYTDTPDYQHGDTIWFVIDTDTWEKEGKIAPLRTFCKQQNKNISDKYDEVKPYRAWNVAQSNPCFEIWLYYHFYDNKPCADEIDKSKSFKDFVNQSINGGFNFSVHPAYMESAIANAKNNFALKEGTLDSYSTEMFLLGSEILKFTKRELDKLKNKLG